MSDTFHPLANDEPYPAMANAPVLLANSPQDKKSVNKQTTEAPCDEDGKPMDADSFHHRGK